VGAQGIHRRKKARRLHKVDDKNISEGDVGRLFGRFGWSPFTPAGALERNGFFLRQFKRNGYQGVGSFIAQAKWVFIMIAGLFLAIAIGARVL
jgi:hypothetical protein